MTDDRDGSGEAPQGEREDRPELDVDTAFAAIVAGWGEPVPEGGGRWPEAEDMPARPARRAADPDRDEDDDEDGPASVEDDPPVARPSGPLLPRLAGEPVPELEDDTHDRFVPPEPPPLPRGDLATRLAWAGVAVGPVFLLFAALFWQEAPQLLLMAAVVGFIGGFVTLVLRMPRDRSSDDDDGAVV